MITMNTMKKKIVSVIVILLITVLTLSMFSCSSKGSASDNFYVEQNNGMAGEIGSSEIVEKPADSTVSTGGDGSKIIKTADIYAETKDYAKATEELKALITSLGGHISSSSASENASYNSNGKGEKNAKYVIKIPSDKFDLFLDGVEDKLNVTNLTTSTEDVSESYFTLQARISTLQSKREGLVSMLQNVDVNTDFTTWQKINAELTEIDTQLTIYNNQLQSLENRVAFSTVTLSVREVVEYTEKEEKSYGDQVAEAFKESIDGVVEFFKGLFLVIIAVFPFLLIWGVFVLVVVLIVRANIKKKRAKNEKKENESDK